MDFKTLLKKDFILLDGAMGTLIQKSGAKYDHCPETLNLTHPELITSFHRAYIEAGADIVYTNTFGANEYKLEESGRFSWNEQTLADPEGIRDMRPEEALKVLFEEKRTL